MTSTLTRTDEAPSALVVLTDTEQAIVKHVARTRFEKNRARGVVDAKIGPQSNEQTDVDGFGAEMAAAKLLNCWPDFQTDDAPTADLMLNDWSIDVKATSYPHGKLLARLSKSQEPCDIYLLMVGTFPEYRCPGFAYRKEMFSDEAMTDLGWGNTYAIEQENLRPVEQLDVIRYLRRGNA